MENENIRDRLEIDKQDGCYGSPRISSEFMDCSLPLTFDQYSYCSFRCKYCVLEGSKIIMADGSRKKIEDIKVGEKVMSSNVDDNFKTEPSEVTFVFESRIAEEIYKIDFFGRSVYLTGEHPVYTKDGWVEVSKLKNGDYLRGFQVYTPERRKKRSEDAKKDVYKSLLSENGKENTLKYLKSDRNPMKSEEVRAKVSAPMYERWREEGCPNKGRARPDLSERLKNGYNPMKDLERRKILWKKGRETLSKKGYSEGESKLYNMLEKLGIGFEKEFPVNQGDGKRCYFLDTAIPKYKIDIEYDGHSRHETYGKVYDEKRDSFLKANGWKVLRIKRNEIFNENFALKKIEKFLSDNLGNPYSQWAHIYKIKKIIGKFKVHNFECSPNNNYMVDHYLVHNCFAFYSKTNNPAIQGKIKLKPVNLEKLVRMFKGEEPDNNYYKNFIAHRFPFHWGGLADPFDYVEDKFKVGFELLKVLAEKNYPTIFSTKGVLPMKEPYYSLFKEAAKNKNFAFQFSIIVDSDKTSKEIDTGAPSTSERLSCMEAMSKLGYWTILRLRPFIVGITDVGLESLINRAADFGCNALSTEFFCLDVRHDDDSEVGKRYKEISEICGFNIRDFYKNLSPSSRGGYRRLNRNFKEEYVKRMYAVCKKRGMQFGISDPDYKELNDSGSCCGLPEVAGICSEGLTRWSKGQLTYHLKELRKRYWKSGGADKYLRLEDIFPQMSNNWADETGYYGDSLKCWNTDWARGQMNHKYEFVQTWNNLRGAGNPYNYFDGKIKPSFLDENNNVVFEYVPHDYEKRWEAEGLL